jgi:hypothetical protein
MHIVHRRFAAYDQSMNKLLDTTQVVGATLINGTPHEVCAEAEATHDKTSGQLTVNLRGYLRTLEHTHLGESAAATWLPSPEVIREHVDHDEASEMAKDVFSSWCHKVQHAIPESGRPAR